MASCLIRTSKRVVEFLPRDPRRARQLTPNTLSRALPLLPTTTSPTVTLLPAENGRRRGNLYSAFVRCPVQLWSGSGVEPIGPCGTAAARPALRDTTGHHIDRARDCASKFVRCGARPAAYSARPKILAAALRRAERWSTLSPGWLCAAPSTPALREFWADGFQLSIVDQPPGGLANL